MGIYIKDMKMPKSCVDCGYKRGCKLLEDVLEQQGIKYGDFIFTILVNYRLDGCPLIEIAEPHGRIIDESQISEATRWRGGYEMSMSGDMFETDAPTLIEREG